MCLIPQLPFLLLIYMRKNTGFIIVLLRRYGWRLALVFFLNFISVLLSILVFMLIEPFCRLLFRGTLDGLSPISSFFVSLLGKMVDLQAASHSMFGLVVAAILLYLFKNLFAYLSQWVMASMRSDLIFTLRNQLYDKILHLPLGYFNSQRRGDVVSRGVNDTHEIEFTILSALRIFLTDPITIVFYLVVLFYISVRLSLYSLILLPATFLIIGWITRSLRKDAKTSKQRLGSLLSHVEETLSGLRIIKGFNAQQTAQQVFDRLNTKFSDKQRYIYRKIDIASPFGEFLGVSFVMVVLVIGGMLVLSPTPTLTAELFITYIALFSQIINPVKNLSTAFANYRRGQSALDRLNEILDVEESITSPENPVPLNGFHDSIVLKDLSFAYGDKPVLDHLDLEIHKGQVVALIGQSGAGKTTIADILERFYDPINGAVLLDGIDIRSYDIHQYRSLFALVSQDVVLFNDTIYNNIVLGRTDVSTEDVLEAARVANIFDFIQTLPDGLQHNIGDRGLNLSGGQRQRLSIARAVLHNAPILILDEATSAMDTESERLVQAALDNVMQNRTAVVIAHRLSTIQKADNIVVLDQGRVVEQGRHEKLLAQCGVYSRMVKGVK